LGESEKQGRNCDCTIDHSNTTEYSNIRIPLSYFPLLWYCFVIISLTFQVPHARLAESNTDSTSLANSSILRSCTSHLLSLNCGNHLPCVLRISEFEVPYALPCARVQLSICDRDRDARANQRRLDMRGHVIAAFCIMAVQSLALLVFRHNAVQRCAHVRANILIPVLVQ